MTRTQTSLAALAVLLLAACGGGDEPPKAAEPAPGAAAEPTPAAPAAPTAAAATGDTITVRMVTTQSGAAGQFEPATVTARPGDVLHFVADGGAAHNVDFTALNPGTAGMPAPSTYLVADGQAVDVPVTFPVGTYNFQCDPHVATGMKGVLTVTG